MNSCFLAIQLDSVPADQRKSFHTLSLWRQMEWSDIIQGFLGSPSVPMQMGAISVSPQDQYLAVGFLFGDLILGLGSYDKC